MRAESARVPIRHTRSTALSHLPLRRLALCLDCEACFEIGASSCLACGGDTWVLLSKFLDQGPLKVLPQFHPFPKSWTAESKGGRDDSHGQAAKQIFVVARDREKLFDDAVNTLEKDTPIDVVMLPMKGDPLSTRAFWRLARRTSGSFVVPSRDWP